MSLNPNVLMYVATTPLGARPIPLLVGDDVGEAVGEVVGESVVGEPVGESVGAIVGPDVGDAVLVIVLL